MLLFLDHWLMLWTRPRKSMNPDSSIWNNRYYRPWSGQMNHPLPDHCWPIQVTWTAVATNQILTKKMKILLYKPNTEKINVFQYFFCVKINYFSIRQRHVIRHDIYVKCKLMTHLVIRHFKKCQLFKMALQRANKKVECHLCEEIIHRRDWYVANHREVCGLRHSEFLKNLQRYKLKYCPNCQGPLLLWPLRGPSMFECHETQLL